MTKFVQVTEQQFNRKVNATKAYCSYELGMYRYSDYYADRGDGDLVARIDNENDTYEIVVEDSK